MYAAGTLVIRKRDGYILTVSYNKSGKPDDWGLPCGKAEPGETPEQTAYRETFEETGIAVEIDSLLYTGQGRTRTVYTFLAYADDFLDDEPTSSAEGEARWAPPETILGGTFDAYNRAVLAAYEAHQKASKRRILLVDDDGLTRKSFLRVLRGQGHEITEASDGQEALSILQQRAAEFDLVISDVQMPVMNGIDLALEVKEKFPGTPIVLHTFGNPYDAESRAGVRCYPKDDDTLLRIVKEHARNPPN